ncbi:hypothetical protein K449DRAFT_380697 [Hypoxylon sp. EC38]|nr:hypothetical protein K449DRAFT_380697 [Hypoxylon sp. EC38]
MRHDISRIIGNLHASGFFDEKNITLVCLSTTSLYEVRYVPNLIGAILRVFIGHSRIFLSFDL